MFLHEGRFIKQIKTAYKTKLSVGNIDGKLFIASSIWIVVLDNQHVPNKIKAILTELAGELPREGITFEFSINEPEPKVIDKNYLQLFKDIDIARDKVVVTPLILENINKARVLGCGKDIICISEELFQMIDKTKIDLDIEDEPIGPVRFSKCILSPLLWHNSICKLLILPINLKESKLINHLSEFDFKD